jgi:hypothetical protein
MPQLSVLMRPQQKIVDMSIGGRGRTCSVVPSTQLHAGLPGSELKAYRK